MKEAAPYGPEEYVIGHATPGNYKLHAKYHGYRNHHDIATVSVQAQIILNFGRKNETRKTISLRIPEQKMIDFGSVKWEIKE